jgi:transcription termination factor NusB
MANILDKELVKQSLKELMVEEPDFFKELLSELFQEDETIDELKYKTLTSKNFTRFDKTFRNLA